MIQQLTKSYICTILFARLWIPGKKYEPFFDISKAFDRVWHRRLIHKLQGIGLSGEILDRFHNYLTSRQQRVVLNGKASAYKTVPAGVNIRSSTSFSIHT